MNDDLVTHRLGTITLDPMPTPASPVVAGELGTWTLTYTVGSYGIDEGGTLKLSQRFASDWDIPQFDDPAAPGYCAITTNGDAKLRPYYHAKAHERPWMKCLVIDVYDGSLAPGETVTLVLGDTSGGSPGFRAQTFQESAHEFRWLVDPTNASVARPLPTSPKFPVVAGEPASLVCLVPTTAVVGEHVDIFLKGEDVWGNPTLLSAADDGATFEWVGEGDVIVERQRLVFGSPGRGWLIAHCNGMTTRSNPITGIERRGALTPFWGDLHAQTDATVGTGTEEEYFTFGRDFARLDFTSHQGNDFQVTDEDWQRLNATTKRFNEEGRFVVFPGYEWSANTTAGGDRNVFYLEEGMPIFRSSHWQVSDIPESATTPAHPADDMFKKVREHVPLEKVLLGSHVGGRYADIRQYFDEELGPLVEVVSCWGVFEWMLWDAFDKGYIVGVMCNSDGHKGRPGAEGPGAGDFGIASGLTCVLAEDLTRRRVFEALQSRRCYGTTGPRIELAFEAAGMPMGSVLSVGNEAVAIKASVAGTAPLESLELFRGRDLIERVAPAAFADCDASNRIRVSWRGARIRGRGRRVTWDGSIRVAGATIAQAATYQFDAANDGIKSQSDSEIVFRSRTTGDTDGIDIVLDDASTGSVTFDSPVGSASVNLAELKGAAARHAFAFGGLDIEVVIERYPETLDEYLLSLDTEVTAAPGATTPYFVKATQEDGHMAWSSPIYLQR